MAIIHVHKNLRGDFSAAVNDALFKTKEHIFGAGHTSKQLGCLVCFPEYGEYLTTEARQAINEKVSDAQR